jgi:hypothetical protein
MGVYVFRLPKDTPDMTYANLSRLLWESQRTGQDPDIKVGTTVRISWLHHLPDYHVIVIWLYDLAIAHIREDSVTFMPKGDDGHKATNHWLSVIARHNGIAFGTGRIKRLKADGPGPEVARGQAGLLVLDWNRECPVVGKTYQVRLENRARTLWAYER